MLLPRTSLLAFLAAGALLASGCGSSDDSAVTFVNTDTEPARTDTQAVTTETATVPTTTSTTVTVTPPTTTTPTTTTPGDTGGATVPQDGGTSSGDTGGTTVPNDTGSSGTSTSTPGSSTTPQDPDCKPGTGPGHPDRPQCEPASGPDSRPDETG
jgi:hypothetical protein